MTRTVPLSATTSSRSRMTVLVSATALAALTLTGCSALGFESKYDKTASYEFSTPAEGKGVVPVWVPEGATELKEIQRTTGKERILRMKHAGSLPGSCLALGTAGKPTTRELTAGLESEPGVKSDAIADIVATQYQTPLLSADWWPAGKENQATHLCGKWWVSQEAGVLYAFSPEQQAIAEPVLAEQAAAQRAERS
ncbi:hypothetical protein ACSYDW_13465 [Paeniglutamicibacter sp. R2-26]|uniref:hypothetical protein n=1 Tax=Paeniglutamicibacter sp. R2-26 TaxID=3144417 RepID=UPI003EE42C22